MLADPGLGVSSPAQAGERGWGCPAPRTPGKAGGRFGVTTCFCHGMIALLATDSPIICGLGGLHRLGLPWREAGFSLSDHVQGAHVRTHALGTLDVLQPLLC